MKWRVRLNCPNCKNETQGIKLNGKIFCNLCGELIKDQAEILEEAYQRMPNQTPQVTAVDNQSPEPYPQYGPPPQAKRIPEQAFDEVSINQTEPEFEGQGETEETAQTESMPQTLPANPDQLLASSVYEKEINELEAEEEILDLIEELPTPKDPEIESVIFENQPIIKQNRNRAGMVVIKGEPDPITFPELEAPEEIQLESHYEKDDNDEKMQAPFKQEVSDFEPVTQVMEPQLEVNTDELNDQNQPKELLIDDVNVNDYEQSRDNRESTIAIEATPEDQDKKELKIEANDDESGPVDDAQEAVDDEPVNKVDDSFFKERISQAIEDPDRINLEVPKKKSLLPEGLQFVHTADDNLSPNLGRQKSRKKNDPNKKTLLPTSFKKPLLVTSLVLLLISGVVGLALYVNNYAIKEEKIAARIEAAPVFDYKQPGYLPPGYNLSYESNSSTDYIEYKYYKFDRSETITLRANSVETNTDIFEDFVKKTGSTYKNISVNDLSIWIVEDKKIYFRIGNVLYEIISSAEIPEGEVIKIAEGLID